jgi:effector-binding domain-containing protein
VAYEIEVVERERQPVLCVREKVPPEIGDLVGRLIGEVWRYMEGAGVHPSGGPYARSIWQPGTEVEVGFPVAEPVAGEGRVVAAELSAGSVAVTTHVGPYDKLGPAYDAVRGWIAQQGLEIAGLPWEVYLTDPGETPDPNDWRTEVVFPVQ